MKGIKNENMLSSFPDNRTALSTETIYIEQSVLNSRTLQIVKANTFSIQIGQHGPNRRHVCTTALPCLTVMCKYPICIHVNVSSALEKRN